MDRRTLLGAAATLPISFAARGAWGDAPPFSAATVRDAARALAAKPFAPQNTDLPGFLADITYDQYRMIRFDKAHALWGGTDFPWQVEFFHRGSIYKGRVDVNEVVDGQVVPVRYTPDQFSFGPLRRPTDEDLGYAGFRLHAPINRPDYFDEVCAFLGASYFRAVAKGLGYGMSARGLAIKTADPAGEEFPYFKTFWIERPKPGRRPEPIAVHALLESQSATAAFEFRVAPGVDTVIQAAVTLFPRVDIDEVGVAPLTSMFLFDGNERHRVDDWRPAVHDSDGLLMATGHGEMLWRQLNNPTRLQVSAFQDHAPKGFGLLQRKRSFADYEDLESRYEKRPGVWVEPTGDWGDGAVFLVEIPSDKEINDNIAAFWRPKNKLQAGGTYDFGYRLHWSAAPPLEHQPALFTNTMIGPGADGAVLFVLDLAPLPPGATPRLDVTSDKGALRDMVSIVNPVGGWRVSFELAPNGASTVEVHARLMQDDTPLTETWLYRWTT